MRMCVHALAELDGDMVVSALDVTNALNCIKCLHCLVAVRRLLPELAPFVELWYDREGAYSFRDSESTLHDLLVNEGVE